jgi:protein-tyrosine phosphatase
MATSLTAAPSGTWNFRDLGGTRTADGRTVRPGRLLRSATLEALDADGQQTLLDLGVRTVFDLRGVREIARTKADVVPDGVTVRIEPFNPEEDETPVHEGEETVEQVAEDVVEEAAEDASRDPGQDVDDAGPTPAEVDALERRTAGDWMRVWNRQVSTAAPAQQSVANLLRELGSTDGAVLVHCAAGKDRTGWAVATVLTALGVSWDDVLADFLLSDDAAEDLGAYMDRAYPGRRPERELLGVQASYLEAARDGMLEAFGSFEGYLAAIGITDADLERLRAALLEPGASDRG